MNCANPYIGAYPFLKGRRRVWREIARFVQKDAAAAHTVVELGAGYCDFINQFPARRKIAFDLNPEMAVFAAPEVELRTTDATTLPGIEPESVDLVFASNFLEHLNQHELDALLPRIRSVLSPRGRLILIQPNYRLCADRYFEDPTHRTKFDDASIVNLLAAHALRVVRVEPALLPFSMRSRLPQWACLTRLYLRSPIKPLAAQMYVVAERA
ncbi:MAG TPA: class I SAM-dependent methyltransferase [Myxococcota bacterium]|nr:class I SAM-dependent methyltransferase [Myxococcota bacterium]